MSEKLDAGEEYRFIEVGAVTYRSTPPQMIKLENLEEWRKGKERVAQYSSVFRYLVDDPGMGAVLSGFPLDFDYEKNPDVARKEALLVAKDLHHRFQIPGSSILINFSGHKGIHLFINRHVFGVEPSADLPLVWKSMAKELEATHRLKTLDFKVYHRRAMWRLPNSIHPESGLHKIPLTLIELEKLRMTEIQRMAVKPRDLPLAKEYPLVPEARTWYLKHVNVVEEWLQERKTEFNDGDLAFLSNDPPCVAKRFTIGAEEGIRNLSCFQLSVYFARKGKPLEEIRQLISEFNLRCTPPLDQREVYDAVESAWQGVKENRYRVGCSSESLADYCDRQHCPFFTGPEPSKVFSPEIREEALKHLTSPDLEQWTESVYDKLIVRERENKLLCHYLELSGRHKNPGEKQIIVLQGDPGGGKTNLANNTTRFHKTKKRARFSEHALDYSDLAGYHILYVQEILGLTKEEEGVSTVRFLSADDQGYSVEITVRDPKTGKFTTQEYRIPPMCVVSTTIAIDLDPQFERRAWLLNMDQSEEQTRLILEHKAESERQWFQELMGLKKPDPNIQVLECAISMLEDGEVVVPYPRSLTKALDVTMLRSRGDYDKVKALIKLRAWYHQKQRRCFTTQSGSKIWVATPEDGIIALKLAGGAMRRWATKLDERLMQVVPYIKELVKEPVYFIEDESGREKAVYGVTSEKLAKKLRKSQGVARDYLKALADREVLTYTHGKRGTKIYEFMVPEEEIENKLKVASVLESAGLLLSEFQKEAETFLTPDLDFQKQKIGEGTQEVDAASTQNRHLKTASETASVQLKAIYHKIPAAGPCELCGSCATEYEVQMEDGSVLRRCPSCFQKLRSMLSGVEFIEKDED